MKKTFLTIILIFCIVSNSFGGTVLWTSTSYNICSWDGFNSLNTGDYTIGYFNGEGLNYHEAEKELRLLNRFYEPFNQLYSGRSIHYRLLYNSSGGGIAEVERILLDRSENTGAYDFKHHFDVLMAAVTITSLTVESIILRLNDVIDGYTKLSNWLWEGNPLGKFFDFIGKNNAKNIAETLKIYNDMVVSTPEFIESYIEEHKNIIEDEKRQGRKLVFISHSQGSFYANIAYDYTLKNFGPNNLQSVYIAPISPHIKTDDYIIANHDKKVAEVNKKENDGIDGKKYLEPNFKLPDSIITSPDSGFINPDWHSFSDVYMASSFGGDAMIKNLVDTTFERAFNQYDKAPNFTDIMTVSLKWEGASDIDLHITKKDLVNPSKVLAKWYWLNKKHSFGYIITGHKSAAAELFFAQCNPDVIAGKYLIGYNHYSGNEAANARFTIKFPFGLTPIEREVFIPGPPLGAGGANRPSNKLVVEIVPKNTELIKWFDITVSTF